MPIFKYDGKKYNVKDEYIDSFMKDFPDAFTIMEREGKRYRVKSVDYRTFMSEQTSSPLTEQDKKQLSVSAEQPETITANQGITDWLRVVDFAGVLILLLVVFILCRRYKQQIIAFKNRMTFKRVFIVVAFVISVILAYLFVLNERYAVYDGGYIFFDKWTEKIILPLSNDTITIIKWK